MSQPCENTTKLNVFWLVFLHLAVCMQFLQLSVLPSHADWQMERLRCYIVDA